jgi:hypothetical protein
MGQADLRAIRAGAMDPEGRGMTKTGYVMGIVGTLGTLLLFIVVGWMSLRSYGFW